GASGRYALYRLARLEGFKRGYKSIASAQARLQVRQDFGRDYGRRYMLSRDRAYWISRLRNAFGRDWHTARSRCQPRIARSGAPAGLELKPVRHPARSDNPLHVVKSRRNKI